MVQPTSFTDPPMADAPCHLCGQPYGEHQIVQFVSRQWAIDPHYGAQLTDVPAQRWAICDDAAEAVALLCEQRQYREFDAQAAAEDAYEQRMMG